MPRAFNSSRNPGGLNCFFMVSPCKYSLPTDNREYRHHTRSLKKAAKRIFRGLALPQKKTAAHRDVPRPIDRCYVNVEFRAHLSRRSCQWQSSACNESGGYSYPKSFHWYFLCSIYSTRPVFCQQDFYQYREQERSPVPRDRGDRPGVSLHSTLYTNELSLYKESNGSGSVNSGSVPTAITPRGVRPPL